MKRHTRSLTLALAAAVVITAIGVAVFTRLGRDPAALSIGTPRRDVLLITLDTTRRDYLGCYGRTPSRTLAIDDVAKHAVRFDDASTTVPITLAAHSSLFTGLYPTNHGVHYNYGYELPAPARTLAEILKESGWSTRAAVAAFVLDPIFGIAQGFERYRAPPRSVSRPGAPAPEEVLPAHVIVDRVLEDLAELAPGGDAPGSDAPGSDAPDSDAPDSGRKPSFYWATSSMPTLLTRRASGRSSRGSRAPTRRSSTRRSTSRSCSRSTSSCRDSSASLACAGCWTSWWS